MHKSINAPFLVQGLGFKLGPVPPELGFVAWQIISVVLESVLPQNFSICEDAPFWTQGTRP